MNAQAIDIKDILIEQNMGLVFGQNLFIARMPPKPLKAVCIYDIPGNTPDLSLTGETYNREGVQFVVRDVEYTKAMITAYAILGKLHGQANIEKNNSLYTLIRTNLAPSVMEWDAENRISIIFSVEIQRRQV